MSELASTTPRGPLFRLAHRPDPWAWPPWTYCRRANRWDDPTDTYRVLYASTERRATFLETLARFRPDPVVVAGLAEISGNDEGALPSGAVVREAHREFTQEISLYVFGRADSVGAPTFSGLACRSRLGDEFTN